MSDADDGVRIVCCCLGHKALWGNASHLIFKYGSSVSLQGFLVDFMMARRHSLHKANMSGPYRITPEADLPTYEAVSSEVDGYSLLAAAQEWDQSPICGSTTNWL